MFKSMMRVSKVIVILGFVGNCFAAGTSAGNPTYVIKGDTVYDKKTDLTWARCSVGQQWKEGTGCAGLVKTFTFDEAQQQSGSGWRVPTKDELGTLVDRSRVESKEKPTIDEVAFPNMDLKNLGYWTSTPASSTGGWDVYFLDGSITGYYGYRSNTLAVRLVRGGQ